MTLEDTTMWDTTQPLARKPRRHRNRDRDALAEDQPNGASGSNGARPNEPAPLTARQAWRVLTALLPVQVLRRRGAIKARRMAAGLARRRPRLIQQLISRMRAEQALAHANAELDRFDEKHKDSEPGRLGRAIRSPYKELAIGVLALFDVLAYKPAVRVLFDLEDTAMGQVEQYVLALISVGMVVTAAVAAHHVKLYHEELVEVDQAEAPVGDEADGDGVLPVSIAGRIHLQMGAFYGALTVAFLAAGAAMRAENAGVDLFSTTGLAMLVFSAIPLAAASAIEYLGTSGLRHRRDGLVNEQIKAIRAMTRPSRFEGRYGARWEKLNLLWATIEPIVQVQLIDAEADVMLARGTASNGLDTTDGRLPADDGLAPSELVGLPLKIEHLAPAKAEQEARRIAARGLPAAAEEKAPARPDHETDREDDEVIDLIEPTPPIDGQDEEVAA